MSPTAQHPSDPGRGYGGAVPPTPAEAAVASAQWERRGLLGRLVRIEEPRGIEELYPAALGASAREAA
jgi:hypothetical protein